MEEVKKVWTPSYENELSIYEKETLQKIKEFKNARSDWLTRNVKPKIYTNVKEGLDELNVYKGRCICLRKLRIGTNLLRTHFKSLRPLRYYTLRRTLTNPEEEEFAMERLKTAGEKKTGDLEQICSSGEMWTKDAVDECYWKAEKSPVKSIQKRKKKECKQLKPRGPCKKAIKKLKASTLKDGIIESCKCDEGREVTVVIKGICLCDKNSLNNLDLNKVCDKYSKLGSARPEGTPVRQPNQETLREDDKEIEVSTDELKVLKGRRDNIEALEARVLPREEEPVQEPTKRMDQRSLKENRSAEQLEKALLRVEDSLEIHKKRIMAKPEAEIKEPPEVISARASDSIEIYKKGESFGNKKEQAKDDINTKEWKSAKKITFRDIKPDKEVKPKLEGTSNITLFPKLSSNDSIFADSDTKLKVEILPRTQNKRDKHAGKKSFKKNELKQDKLNLPTSESMKNLLMNEDSTHNVNNTRKPERTRNAESKSFGESSAVLRSGKNSETAPPARGRERPETETQQLREESLRRNEKTEIPESKLKSETGDQQKPEVKRADNTDSVVTLYENKPEEKSEMGLTKEELEKLNENQN